MSRKNVEKIVGAAFENMSAADMERIQGAGDVDGETLQILVKSSNNCIKSAATVVTAISGYIFGKD